MPTIEPGYFTDASGPSPDGISVRIDSAPPVIHDLDVELLSHDFKPTVSTNTAITSSNGQAQTVRPGIGMSLFSNGGGSQRITVPFWARRNSRGDAEFYLYEMLKQLGRSDLGDLVTHGRAYRNVWFIGGEGHISHAYFTDPDGITSGVQRKPCFHVQGTLRFVRGLPSDVDLDAPGAACPPDPGALATGNNAGNYRALRPGLNLRLGRFADLAGISVTRPVLETKIPRCWGVRIAGRNHTQVAIRTQLDYRRGRRMSLNFRASCRCETENDGTPAPVSAPDPNDTNAARLAIEKRLLDTYVKLRDEPVTLVGNGCVFYGCYLQNISPEDDPDAFSSINYDMTFEQNLNEVQF